MTQTKVPAAVLVTGPYGSGKTSVVEEIADLLEGRHVRYGAIDLDWLGWYDSDRPDHDAGSPIMLRNLKSVVAHYLEVGVERFAIAGACSSAAQVEEIRETLAMPLTVVRLTLPIEEIRRRLGTAVTSGREDDLRVAEEWVADGRGEDVGDLILPNDRPIRDVAAEILDRLGW